MFKPIVHVLFALLTASASLVADADTCHWDGTAPFCAGSCGSGESEFTRMVSIPEHWQDASSVIQNTDFGEPCWTGSKALCCPTAVGTECRWAGTGPFCRGSCGPGEQERTPPPGSSGGQGCVPGGSKVYCCRSATASSRSALRINADLTSFAALWDKSTVMRWEARHRLSASQYQQTFDQLVSQGFRPVVVRGYGINGKPTYAAIFEQRTGPLFVARHNLSRADYQREFDRWTRQGYRPVDAAGFAVGGTDRYTAIYEKVQGAPFRAFHGISAAAYQREFDRAVRDGFRPVRVNGHALNGRDYYTAIFEKRTGPAVVARHGMAPARYQQEFEHLARQGYRLVQLSSWKNGNAGRYAGIWELTDGPPWQALHGMLGDTYQEEFDKALKAGYRLRELSAYHLYD
jgi:Bacterial tandem repeat domain 1